MLLNLLKKLWQQIEKEVYFAYSGKWEIVVHGFYVQYLQKLLNSRRL